MNITSTPLATETVQKTENEGEDKEETNIVLAATLCSILFVMLSKGFTNF